MEYFVTLLVGYLLGSFPSGVVVGRLTKGVDVRRYGSGNIGMTNVLRTVGVKAGVVVLLLDVGKGTLAAYLGWTIGGSELGTVLAATAAVLGHNWPVWLKFRGGRGVSTGVGGLAYMLPAIGLIAFSIAVVVMLATRYVSLGSIAATATATVVVLVLASLDLAPREYIAYAAISGPIILLRHWSNMVNLLRGKELRLGTPATRTVRLRAGRDEA